MARLKYKTQKIAVWAPSHNLSRYIFATKAYVDNCKKNVKQQYLLHMSPRYGELLPTNGLDLLASLGHPNKFQPLSRLGFVTAPTSLNGGQQNFAGCLSIYWAGPLYIHFWGCCPVMEFCQLQNSLCVQVLRSLISVSYTHLRAHETAKTWRKFLLASGDRRRCSNEGRRETR